MVERIVIDRFRTFLSVLAACGMVAGSGWTASTQTERPSAEGVRAITVDEFRRQFVDVPLCGRPNIGPMAGKTVCTIHYSDGTAVITGPGIDIRGIWEVEGQKICRRSINEPPERRNCVDYVQLGPNRFRNSTGTEFCIGQCP
jgi:hypothetical protein